MGLPAPNEEQAAIVAAAAAGLSVQVASAAGCGKTTTALLVARMFQELGKTALLLVYNSNLKIETRQQADELGLDNLQIDSFHSFALGYLGATGHTDLDMIRMFEALKNPTRDFAYDAVLLDECQDMTPLYYRVVRAILRHNQRPGTAQIVCFGDANQALYGFMGSDARYLTLASRVFAAPGREWTELAIATSNRVRGRNAAFVNAQLLRGEERVLSARPGGKVVYAHVSAFSKDVLNIVRDAVARYGPDHVMVLAPSLRGGRTPVKVLENALVAAGIPCMATTSDEQEVDQEVANGKITFCSYHQSKGLGRKVVLVFGFDDTYHTYYARSAPPDECPNAMYVASTRASEALVLVHGNLRGYFPTIDQATLRDFVSYKGGPADAEERVGAPGRKPASVTGLLRHMRPDALHEVLKLVRVERLAEPGDPAQLQTKVHCDGGLVESVNDVNGVVLPAMYELETTGSCTILRACVDKAHTLPTHRARLAAAEAALTSPGTSPDARLAAMAYVAVVHQTLQSGYRCKLEQLPRSFDWLDAEDVQPCVERLRARVGPAAAYEVEVSATVGDVGVSGLVDVVDADAQTAWEIKCTEALTGEHTLQLALYAAMHAEPGYSYRLLNLLTGELLEIALLCEPDELLRAVLEHREADDELSDEAFVARCLAVDAD